jgi:hypothetical protein
MKTITFSDSADTEPDNLIFSETEKQLSITPLEEYCKRYPDSLECLEYDV